MIRKDSYVEVHIIVLSSEDRTAKIPEETKKVPYEMFVKGFLVNDADLKEEVSIKTITGRVVKGILIKENPTYELGYGNYVSHIMKIKEILRDEIDG
ncbi:2-amino-4-ketopentanoate thiolase [Mycoplasmatota bacterium]|nr:2-amino-4-ketopentanoate thiolase [Mycoplasmatota bacterium]